MSMPNKTSTFRRGDRVRFMNEAPGGKVGYASAQLIEVTFDDGSGYWGDPGPIRFETACHHCGGTGEIGDWTQDTTRPPQPCRIPCTYCLGEGVVAT